MMNGQEVVFRTLDENKEMKKTLFVDVIPVNGTSGFFPF